MMPWARALLLAAAITGGCATTAPAPRRAERVPEEGPTRHRVKLAVLPVESDNYPRLAKGVNGLFHDIQVTGIDDYFLSKVTLEVAQLAIECVDETKECWSAVGKSLTSDRILLAQIARATKKKHDHSLQLIVTYFDVGDGRAAARRQSDLQDRGRSVARDEGAGRRRDQRRDRERGGRLLTPVLCPACQKALPDSVLSGPAQSVVRCEGCATLLLWSHGKVVRSARSNPSTLMGLPAAKPAPPSTPKAAAGKPPMPQTLRGMPTLAGQRAAGGCRLSRRWRSCEPEATSARSTPTLRRMNPVKRRPRLSWRRRRPAESAKARERKPDKLPEPAKPQIAAAIAQAPSTAPGPMVDPSEWFDDKQVHDDDEGPTNVEEGPGANARRERQTGKPVESKTLPPPPLEPLPTTASAPLEPLPTKMSAPLEPASTSGGAAAQTGADHHRARAEARAQAGADHHRARADFQRAGADHGAERQVRPGHHRAGAESSSPRPKSRIQARRPSRSRRARPSRRPRRSARWSRRWIWRPIGGARRSSTRPSQPAARSCWC